MNLVRLTAQLWNSAIRPGLGAARRDFWSLGGTHGQQTTGSRRGLSAAVLWWMAGSSADSRLDMQRIRSTLLFLGLAGCAVGAVAQQTPSTNTPSGEADSIPQDRATEPAGALPSARGFDGRIVKRGNQFILRNASAHTSYRLDDQKKAGHYEGKRVKVTATMDAVSNTLHVIDISDFTRRH